MKHIALSVVVLGAISCVNAAQDLSSMFSEGKASGQIREFSISRSVTDSRTAKDDYTRSGNAIGGYLKFETADYAGFNMGTALYTTNGFGMPSADYNAAGAQTYTEQDPTLLGVNNDDYSILGEAYIGYKLGNTVFKGGRQKLNTPLVGADDARMVPNLFEAYVLSNSDIAGTTLVAAYVTRFAQGTFGRAYNGGVLAATAGYSAVDSRNQVGEFTNMGTYAVGKKTAGVSVVSATYTGVKNLKLQLWDYYAHDILNAVYAQADFKWNCLLSDSVKPFVSAQLISESDIGDKLAGSVNGMYWGTKVGAKVENFTAYVAYSQTTENSDTEAATENAIITPWGGMPAFTQGMVTRHMFLAGTKATKLAASYNFKAFGPDLKTVFYYASFAMADNNGYTENDADEAGFDFIYKPAGVKNLNLRLRGNFSNDFYVKETDTDATKNGAVGWNEYRFIANYNF